MKIYNTKTQADYNALMIELEEKGCKWFDGKKPTAVNLWSMWKGTTCLRVDNYVIFHGSLDYYKEKYPNENIIEYKAKGTKMTQGKIKLELEEISHDIHVSIYWGLKDISTATDDLSEAKSSAIKIIEKIDEYLESQEHEFKVGDYVVQYDNYITKIDEIDEFGYLIGRTYEVDVQTLEIPKNYVVSKTARIATLEEIMEYDSALNFHNHGRNPFEIKEGDILRDDKGNIFFVGFPNNFKKEHFTRGIYTFLKTAEEYNEWLKGE